MFPRLFLLITWPIALVLAESASSYAGSTSTAVYPPPGSTGTSEDSYFPDASEVGFAGPTPSMFFIAIVASRPDVTLLPAGDEAEAVATAPTYAKLNTNFPLVNPNTADDKGTSFNVVEHWGNLSPFNSVKSTLDKATQQIPEGCQINQVHLLHRHGARYPTSGSAPAAFATTLHAAASGAGFGASGPLSFLNTWTYKLGAEILTPFGREQLCVPVLLSTSPVINTGMKVRARCRISSEVRKSAEGLHTATRLAHNFRR